MAKLLNPTALVLAQKKKEQMSWSITTSADDCKTFQEFQQFLLTLAIKPGDEATQAQRSKDNQEIIFSILADILRKDPSFRKYKNAQKPKKMPKEKKAAAPPQ